MKTKIILIAIMLLLSCHNWVKVLGESNSLEIVNSGINESFSIKYDSIIDFNFTTIEDPFSLVDYVNESFLIQSNNYVTLNFTNIEQSYFWFNQTVNKSIQTFLVNKSQFICFKNKEPFSDVFGSSFNFGILDNPWCYPKGNFTGYTNINQIGNLILIFNNGYDSQVSVLFSMARLVIEQETTTPSFITVVVDLNSSNQIYDEDFSLEIGKFIIYNFEITSAPSKLFINVSVDQYDEGDIGDMFSRVMVSFLNQSAYDNWVNALNSSSPYIYDNYRVKALNSSSPYFTLESEGKYYVILYNNLNITATGHISIKNVKSLSQKTDFIFFSSFVVLTTLFLFKKRRK